jgi:hypothetical protein
MRSILFGKTGIKEGNIQTDKTNPEVLKIKDLLFMIIKYDFENIFRAKKTALDSGNLFSLF